MELLEIWADLAPDRPLQEKCHVVTKLERLLKPLKHGKSPKARLEMNPSRADDKKVPGSDQIFDISLASSRRTDQVSF